MLPGMSLIVEGILEFCENGIPNVNSMYADSFFTIPSRDQVEDE